MARATSLRRAIAPLRDFLATESASAVVLLAAAVTALAWANSPWDHAYRSLWSTNVQLRVGSNTIALSLRAVINEGLMTIFFFVVGLEIHRELTTGHLRDRRAAALPVIAACGGMIVPALIYTAIARSSAPRGWGVPMATDIALALGVLSLGGDRVPLAARAFLLALAIVDDIGAIVVIALFYSTGVEAAWLLAGIAAVFAAVVLRRVGVVSPVAYLPIGLLAWWFLHEAGVSSTLVGVAFGLLTPSAPRRDIGMIDVEQLNDLSTVDAVAESAAIVRDSISMVEWLLYRLHGVVSFGIVPAFALANVGLPIGIRSVGSALSSRVGLAVVAGLVLGKPVGILLAVRISRSFGLVPGDGVGEGAMLAVALVAGIGFTVALFVTDLAFLDDQRADSVRLAVFSASLVAGVLGFVAIRRLQSRPPRSHADHIPGVVG